MKLIVPVGRITVEVEGDDQKTLFKELGAVSEIFAESACGCCGSADIRFDVRNVESNSYYEMKCNGCGARLSYGQHKTGGSLFPKRKLNREGQPDMENGAYGQHNGWHKWQGKDGPPAKGPSKAPQKPQYNNGVKRGPTPPSQDDDDAPF